MEQNLLKRLRTQAEERLKRDRQIHREIQENAFAFYLGVWNLIPAAYGAYGGWAT